MEHRILTPKLITKCLLKTVLNSIGGSSRMINLRLQPANSESQEVDLFKVRIQNRYLRNAAENYEANSIDKFLMEGGIRKSVLSLPFLKKKYLIFLNIDELKKNDLLPGEVNIVEQLLSNLEPFNFDSEKLPKNSENRTLKILRDEIERQYLASKFHLHLSVIKKLLGNFKKCLVPCRALSSLQANVDLINSDPELSNMKIGSKIYLLTMKPLCKEILLKFQEDLVGVPWGEVAEISPKLISRPYDCILLFVDALRDKGFTDDQIRSGLPYFKDNIPYIVFRLNCILKSPKFSLYKNHKNFLSLLYLNARVIKELEQQNWNDLSEIINQIQLIRPCQRFDKSTIQLFVIISRYLDITPNDLSILCRNNKWKKFNIDSIIETIKYLKSEFTNVEILESISIILYPRHLVEFWVNQIRKNPEFLKKFGFRDGFTSSRTDTFKNGTHSSNKTLQLCVYLMEKYDGVDVMPETLAKDFN